MTPHTPRGPMSRARRVLLSALAGGGLTAVGLTPLVGRALAADIRSSFRRLLLP